MKGKFKKSYGQHFLTDKSVLADILKAAELNRFDKNQKILEIGPGLGVLTKELIKFAGKVMAVEADRELVGLLIEALGSHSNLTIAPSPIQHFRLNDYFEDQNYLLVANLPYNISSYVLRSFIEYPPRPKLIVVMVQKEVAERAIAKAGQTERGILSLAIELLTDQAEIVRLVSPKAFQPRPKVDSAILKLVPKKQIEPNLKSIMQLAKMAFNQRRKKIANSLASGLLQTNDQTIKMLEEAKIDPNARPQTLTIQDWQEMFRSINLKNAT